MGSHSCHATSSSRLDFFLVLFLPPSRPGLVTVIANFFFAPLPNLKRVSVMADNRSSFGEPHVFDVAGSSSLALVLGVACSPGRTLLLNIGCTPSCLLLRTVATLALAVAALAPPLACVCGRRSGQRARASTGRAPSQPCVRLGAASDYVYLHTRRFQWPICAIFR